MPAIPDLKGLPPTGASYWARSRQPLASLVFIAPLLVIYEAGVLLLGPRALRNGADVWMRELINALGFSQYFLLPVLTVCLLLGWHYLTRQSWRVSRDVLYGMTVESVLLAICLRFLLHLQGIIMSTAGHATESPFGVAGTMIGYLGAGIYEELLFRLILLGLVMAVLWWLRRPPAATMVAAVVLSSLLFSIAHYIGPYGDKFLWFTFVFRFLAGASFSLLFMYRGFGIAAGAHAGYDLLVGMSAAFA